MNYYQARQKESDEKWHFTCLNDDVVWPVGYCSKNCPGHDTAEEANEHYHQWKLDNATFDLELTSWGSCRVPNCDVPTKVGAWVNGVPVKLCERHSNRASLELCVSVSTHAASSY